MCTCFLNGPACPWKTNTLDCLPCPKYVRLKASSAVSLSASTAFSMSITSTFVIGSVCWQVGQRCCSIVPPPSMTCDRCFEQEVIHLGVPLGLPDVFSPDVRTVIGDQDGVRGLESLVCERLLHLVDQFTLERC